MEKVKSYDAVKMVRQIRDAHYEQLKDKSVEERLALYKAKSEALRAEIAEKRQRERAGE